MVQRDENTQNRLKEPLIAELNSNKEQKEDKEDKIGHIEKRIIPEKENKIEELKREINEIRKNSILVMPDKLSKVGFVIGLLILLVLTIYLFIFYSSASFSAFFKSFSLSDLGVASSIFDPNAISEAYKDGVTELILIISMPFVFIGMGFLIHQFQKGKGLKKYFQIIALILVTFVFDAILAYEITEKIYNIKVGNSFQDLPEYNFDLAFKSVNFWLIIFAGFVVYIIWGFVFDFTIAAYDKLDVIKQEIKAREREISYIKDDLNTKRLKVGKLFDDISEIKKIIKNLQGKINGVIIDTTEFDKILHEFLGGWLEWMNANKLDQIRIDEATFKADEFIKINIREFKIHNVN
ncbi:MAG: hypothetical protein L3J35_05515 [Bacteroidales bacterium]|nr:hypothetical protein [Bacteroidales bacterium]